MKTIALCSLGLFFTFAAVTQACAGIYLIYEKNSGSPVAVVDDDQIEADVLEEGYLSPRIPAWLGYKAVLPAVRRTTALPLAFAPPPAGYAVGGYVYLPSIGLIAPTATSSPELSRAIQSGHAWSAYQTGNAISGMGLVYSPSYGASLTPSQKSARGNRARAQAFRLDYYK